MEKTKIKLQLGLKDFPFEEKCEVINVTKDWDSEEFTTLKDIAIILYKCCGQGVGWHFSDEIYKKLKNNYPDLKYKEVVKILEEVISEYVKMPDDEVIEKYKKCRRPHNCNF